MTGVHTSFVTLAARMRRLVLLRRRLTVSEAAHFSDWAVALLVSPIRPDQTFAAVEPNVILNPSAVFTVPKPLGMRRIAMTQEPLVVHLAEAARMREAVTSIHAAWIDDAAFLVVFLTAAFREHLFDAAINIANYLAMPPTFQRITPFLPTLIVCRAPAPYIGRLAAVIDCTYLVLSHSTLQSSFWLGPMRCYQHQIGPLYLSSTNREQGQSSGLLWV